MGEDEERREVEMVGKGEGTKWGKMRGGEKLKWWGGGISESFEGRRHTFSRACGGTHQQVSARECCWDGLSLDGGWSEVAHFFQVGTHYERQNTVMTNDREGC